MQKKSAVAGALDLVPASRLELLRLVATTPSRWRVYQFHHAGTWNDQFTQRPGLVNARIVRAAYFLAGAGGTGAGAGAGAGAEVVGRSRVLSRTDRFWRTTITSMKSVVPRKAAASQ